MLYTGRMNDQTATPTADYDSPWKEALAKYLPDAFALFFPDVHSEIDWSREYLPLDTELQQVTRDADLVGCHGRNGRWHRTQPGLGKCSNYA